MTSLAVLLFVQLLLVGKLSASKGLPEVEQYAEHLAHQRLFAGMLHVEQGALVRACKHCSSHQHCCDTARMYRHVPKHHGRSDLDRLHPAG